MAIVALDKVTLYGSSQQKHAVLDGLQQLGCLHVIDLLHKSTELPEFISKEARQALRLLESSPIHRTKSLTRTEYDHDRVVREVLELHERREELTAEQDQLEEAIAELEPWGNFERPAEDLIGGEQLFFYVVPLRELSELPGQLVWQVVGRNNRFAYVVVLAPQEPATEMPGRLVELDRRSLRELRERLLCVEEELEDLRWQRVSLTRWRRLLKMDLDAADDKAAQAAAANRAWDDESVFALQAWVPRTAIGQVREFAQQHTLAITVVPAGRHESPPTLLSNPRQIAGAEGCVTFYTTPGYHEWDPTGVMFFSLSFFFAMIVADAGYGLVMLCILLPLWRGLGSTPQKASLRSLILAIILATIVYGVMAGSYFGLEPHPGTLLDSLRLKLEGKPLVTNQTAMMTVSVAIGVIHLALANVIAAAHHRGSTRWIGQLGWAVLIVGGFLLGIGVVWKIEPLAKMSQGLLVAGGIAILVFSSDEPLLTTNLKSQGRRCLDGLMQVTNIPKAFGDALSYLRLFALGLSSAQLGVTFNGLAGDAIGAGGIGVLLGLVILVVGHGINFLLGLMGGVVHGLRLNCIEFFSWSLKEEGYPFQPFKRKAEI